VHNFYKPLPNRFKDYIAIPKANGYQSLHTTLIGMNGVPIEIQIRTQEMEDMANHGIAAHWLYKNDDSSESSPTHARARRWVKGLLEMQERAGNPVEFIENVKIDLFPDEIYVFTPKGKILEVPKGATAVDFAYAVHTDIGNSCVGCLINRQIAPLSQPLESGDTIKVITAPGARPNPAWVNFVITAKARSNIRHFLKNLKQSESIALGHKLLNNALRNFDTKLDKLSEQTQADLLHEYGLEKMDNLLEEIGLGDRVAYVVARRLLSREAPPEGSPNNDKAMTVKGTEGLMISYAKCCRPIPGDAIVGVISKGKGMVIHVDSCRNIVEICKNPDRCVHLRWEKSMEGEFVVDLRVEMRNARGVLASVANAVSQADANIESIEMQERDATTSRLNLTVSVTSRQHLARVIRRLHNLKPVGRIDRVQS
jgi:RelA/SpoT family (p)ppGpp synthetase